MTHDWQLGATISIYWPLAQHVASWHDIHAPLHGLFLSSIYMCIYIYTHIQSGPKNVYTLHPYIDE
jgi:hypothetical protein